jgi:hypothetical protein
MTRWLSLFVRSRRLPTALAGALGSIAIVWAVWSLSTDRREVSLSLVVLTVALALAPLIPTLAADDQALESSAALPWPPRRALHLLGCWAIVAGGLVGTRATGAWFGPSLLVVRDCAGLTGLIGLGVALAGTRLAWIVPTSWTALQVLFGAEGGPAWQRALFWLTQEPGDRPAAAVAVVSFLAGLIVYAWRATPAVAPAEATLGQ